MYPPNAFSRFIRLFLLCALLLVLAVPAAAEVEPAAPAPYSQEDQPAPPAPVPVQDPYAAALRAEMDALEAAWEQGPDVFLARLETSSPEARERWLPGITAARLTLGLAPGEPAPEDAQVDVVYRVGINGSACAYYSISAAVAAANPGDTLFAAAATFNESVVINKNLTLVGGYDSSCSAPIIGQVSTIDGVTTTLEVNNNTVTLRNLALTGGVGGNGGGLKALNFSAVTLDNTSVFSNTATNGGGMYIADGATVTTTNGSAIHHNTATNNGGGVRVWGRFAAFGNDSDIKQNQAPFGGGISAPGAVVYLDSADVHQNQATDANGVGGGIYLAYDAGARSVLTATNVAYIYYDNTAYDGAGLYADNADVYLLTGVVLRDNTAAHAGGAIYLVNSTLETAATASIGQAGAGLQNRAVYGGGIYALSSTVRIHGKIINNEASGSGGGLYAQSSVVELTDAVVGGTADYTANTIGSSGWYGAGLYLQSTHASLLNTSVISNVITNPSTGYGAGLYISNGSVVTLTNSSVQYNQAPSLIDGRGAGMYIYGSTVVLDHTDIFTNTAGSMGGGLRLFSNSVVTITNGSWLNDNQTLDWHGGAIAMNSGSLALSDVMLAGNSSAADGGAVYADGGKLQLTGGWTLRENTASGSGGALAVTGTATVNLRAGGYSLVYFNRALGGSGGALYLGNATNAPLYATVGHALYLYANQAQQDGGALAADAGGFFDIYGMVQFDRNWALNGNGGGIYLANGSSTWLDDYVNLRPALWDNRAAAGSGGAIYAIDSPSVEMDGVEVGKPGEGNLAQAGSGGAIYLERSTFLAENCVFMDNQAAQNGGAVSAADSSLVINANIAGAGAPGALAAEGEAHAEGAVQATACDTQLGYCSVFVGNIADSDGNGSGLGGALHVVSSTLTISQTQLLANRAYYGGAVYQAGSAAVGKISNSLVALNSVFLALGAGIRQEAGTFTLQHVTIAANLGGAGFSRAGGTSAITNSIAWGNSDGGFFNATAGTNTCNIDQSGIAGAAVDPQLTGADWQPGSGSPAIGVCPNGLAVDLLGRPRPLDTDYDMGAYEGAGYAVRLPLTLRN